MSHDFKNFPELSNSQMNVYYFDSPHQQILEDFDAKVEKVHDGDTITLSTSFRDFQFPMRFLGIDAPELNAGGKEAGDWLRQQIAGEDVQIKIDRNNRVGKYGRLLGRVSFRGMDLGEMMLQLGKVLPFEQRNDGVIPDFNIKLEQARIK